MSKQDQGLGHSPAAQADAPQGHSGAEDQIDILAAALQRAVPFLKAWTEKKNAAVTEIVISVKPEKKILIGVCGNNPEGQHLRDAFLTKMMP